MCTEISNLETKLKIEGIQKKKIYYNSTYLEEANANMYAQIHRKCLKGYLENLKREPLK